MASRPAIVRSTRQFGCSLSDEQIRVDNRRVRLDGRFRFTTLVDGGGEQVRRFDLAALCLIDHTGLAYRLVEATQGGDAAGSWGGRFRRAHRGVLVGSGRLNNRLLTLLLEFTERADGTATVAVIAARLGTS